MLDDLAGALDSVLPHVLAATETPGVAVALLTSSEVRTVACGYADLARRVPITATSRAIAGSLSKPLVGLALMRVAESGGIDPDAPVDAVLPKGTRPPDEVTPVMLASHQGGYRADIIDARLSPPGPIAEYVRRRHAIGRTPEYGGLGSLQVRPGVYSYSSFGMTVLAAAVEHVTGESFASFVDEQVLGPAGMRDSAFQTATPEPSTWDCLAGGDGFAEGYMSFGDWCVPAPRLHSGTFPACAMVTSPLDYAKLLRSMLRNDGAVVSPESLSAMLTPRIRRASPVIRDSYAGIALELADPALGEDWWWGHTAAFPWGYWWDARVFPHRDLVVVAVATKWDMLRYHNPTTRNAAGIVARLTGQWATSGVPRIPRHPVSRRPRPVQTSETSGWIGGIVAERLHGLLGIEERLSAEAIKAMVDGARPLGDSPAGDWDGAAFESAIDRMAEVAPDPAAIERYGESLGPHAALWALESGATAAAMPIPVPGFVPSGPRPPGP